MRGYIARRLLATIPVVTVVAIFVFLLLRLSGGDPAAIIAGDSATTQQVQEIRLKLGLERPIMEQFVIWVGRILRGDFGESYFFKKTVAELIRDRLEPTVALAICTLVLAVAMAVPLGVVAAVRRGTWIDRTVMGFSVLGFSVPVFVIGYAFIYLFAIELGWLPVQGYQRLAEGFWGFLERLILPSVTLAVIYVALIARITRASVLEVLGADHVRTARAKGLSERSVILKHAMRNALTPVITLGALELGTLLSGAVLTEQIFTIPGFGKLIVDAVFNRDYAVVQGVVLVTATIYITLNLIADVAYILVNPRLRG